MQSRDLIADNFNKSAARLRRRLSRRGAAPEEERTARATEQAVDHHLTAPLGREES
jgi:hypothetical protein